MDQRFISGTFARELYASVESLPIVDYHSHLCPREIYEDKPFSSVAREWLSADHYKWRLMRSVGTDERLITGDAPWHEKFRAYAAALEYAPATPLRHWTDMELLRYFGITELLGAGNADSIEARADGIMKRGRFSPRRMLERSNVEILCTTDDIADDLVWHEKLALDPSFRTRVYPTYRFDNVLLAERADYRDYIARLGGIGTLGDLKNACADRLAYFMAHGCKTADLGIQFFPDSISSEIEADRVFRRFLAGESVTHAEYLGWLGHMYVFFGTMFARRKITAQLHLGVRRNVNSRLYASVGGDCGCDCIGTVPATDDLVRILDAVDAETGLPDTIVYTLDETAAPRLASVIGSYRGARLGAAWWFCDHLRGINAQLDVIAENGALGAFTGMLTDSRSFFSFVRHDYFRRILCSRVGGWVENENYDPDAARRLVEKVCYTNAKRIFGGEK